MTESEFLFKVGDQFPVTLEIVEVDPYSGELTYKVRIKTHAPISGVSKPAFLFTGIWIRNEEFFSCCPNPKLKKLEQLRTESELKSLEEQRAKLEAKIVEAQKLVDSLGHC